MDVNEIQQQLFQTIKRKLSSEDSVAEEVAKLLGISTDSAYRRMRGEKTVTLEELYTLCKNYNISLDQLMGIQSGGILFQGNYMNKETSTFEKYMTGLMHNMAYMNSFKEKEYFYMCKDLPIFHHFHLKEIAAFKRFFWLKTYFEFPGFDKKKFRYNDHPAELFEMEQKVLQIYNEIPSVEIWNLENMNMFFRQIEFYQAAQVFESDNDVCILYEAIEKLWDHLEEQASLGYKFLMGDPDKKRGGDFKMYFNEVLLGDNHSMAVLDGKKISYVTHTSINFMMTMDEKFTENMYNHIKNQMKRSTLISEVSEKERTRFFNVIRERIERRKENLKA